MSEALTILGWLSVAVFVGVILYFLAARLLLVYSMRQIRIIETAAEELRRQGEKSRERVLNHQAEFDRLKAEVDAAVAKAAEVDDQVKELIADKNRPTAAAEAAKLLSDRERIQSTLEDLKARASAFQQNNSELAVVTEVGMAEALRAKRLVERTRRLLHVLELIANVDTSRPGRPEASK